MVTVVYVSVCLSVPHRIPTLLHGPRCKLGPWGNGRGCSLVVHYWADLQLVHRFRCYDNIALNTKCQRVLLLALCLVIILLDPCMKENEWHFIAITQKGGSVFAMTWQPCSFVMSNSNQHKLQCLTVLTFALSLCSSSIF